MNILLIGNGFDLEYGLPTKYVDFLEFVDRFYDAYRFSEANPYFKSKIKDEYLKYILVNSEKNVGKALNEYLQDNIWIAHFKKCV